MEHVNDVLRATDWKLLAQQKVMLIDELFRVAPGVSHPLDGFIQWVNALQEAAKDDGFPVVFLSDDTEYR